MTVVGAAFRRPTDMPISSTHRATLRIGLACSNLVRKTLFSGISPSPQKVAPTLRSSRFRFSTTPSD